MHRMSTIFTDLTLNIFDHTRPENRCDPTHFYYRICALENRNRTDLGFPICPKSTLKSVKLYHIYKRYCFIFERKNAAKKWE